MDPWFHFSRLLLKRVKISALFWQLPNYNWLRIFWWKKNDIGRAIFTLISINGHYCAMSQNLFWPPFLNTITIFKFYFNNVTVFMFSNFESNFICKIPLGKWFFNFFVTWLFFCETTIRFLQPFWNETFFDRFFCLLLLFSVHT